MSNLKPEGLSDKILLNREEVAELLWLGMEAKGAVIPDDCHVRVEVSNHRPIPATEPERRSARIAERKKGAPLPGPTVFVVEIVIPYGADAGSYKRVDMSKPETRHVGRGYAPFAGLYDTDVSDDEETEARRG